MKLYHYNKEKFNTLLNADLQGVVTDEKRKRADEMSKFRGVPGPYYEHVSFLMEPAPVDILGGIFPEDHHTWVTGNKLYEHVVELKDIDLYGWVMVEGSAAMFLNDKMPWFDIDLYKKVAFQGLKLARRMLHEEGKDAASLERAFARIKPGFTREAYSKVKERGDYDDIKAMYAATVPHLMVYTKAPIPVKTHSRVVVGNAPLPAMESTTRDNLWYDW